MKNFIITLFSVIIFQQFHLYADLPQWSVDASEFEFSMTVTSLVYIDDAMAVDPDNILAATVDGQIRGVAYPVHDSFNNQYLFFLTVFSNQFSGEEVLFQLYNATTNTVIELWSDMVFTSGINHGSIANPYLLFSEQPQDPSAVSFIVEDEHGAPINDATVTFNGYVLDPGAYTVDNVYPGTYLWTVDKEGYISQTADVIVAAGVPHVSVTVVMPVAPPEPVFYTVQFTVLSPNGVPLSNVTLNFRDEEFENHLVFNDVEPGTYPYQISAEGYMSMAGHVTVTSADVHIQVTLQYTIEDPDPDTFSIVFAVLDIEGNPLDGVTIMLNDEEYTDQLVFSGLAQGAYNYIVGKEGYINKSGQITLVNANVTVQVTLQQEPVGSEPETYEIHFSVFDMNGNMLEDVNILIDGTTFANQSIITDVEPGTYTYQVTKQGYISREGQITITSSNVFVDIILLEQAMNTINPDVAELRVFPNPASQFVRIDASHDSTITAIEVYNTSGRQVMYAEGYSFGDKIDVAPLAKGVYLFTIILQNDVRIVEKLVIN